MSNTTNDETPDSATASRAAGSLEHRLARLLDTPLVAKIVPRLAPETLHQLIQYRGLEACGELVTSATPAQLASLLDLDLWGPARPGRDEELDVARFGEWLEVLVDTGSSLAARTVAALDTSLVIAGLSRYVRVFDPGIFEPAASTDEEPADRQAMMHSETDGDELECEVGGYLVRARSTDAWDAIVTLLVTLDAEHNDCFHALMHGCRRLSSSTPESDGLDALLLAPDQHVHDVAVERERRRAQQGYATPADARAFLQMARRPEDTRREPGRMNPAAAPYFRALDEGVETADGSAGGYDEAISTSAENISGSAEDVSASVVAIVELLAEAGRVRRDHGSHGRRGMPSERPRALLEAGHENAGATQARLRRLMTFLADHDETAYVMRSRELAFLANTLLAGCSVQSRPFTPAEASEAAAGVCNLGLDTLDPASLHDAFLVDLDLVTTFETGWSALYRDVSLFVADQLIAILADVRCGDADTRHGIRVLRRALAREREAGTPWLARDAADVLAALDMAACTSVLGLLDECPIVPAAMTAILERRTTPVSPTAFQFISTAAQIGDIRLFMRVLPGVLS
jgi:hypothetical protein